MKLSELGDKFKPWSLSKVNVAKQCTLRFFWQYAEKRPQAPVKDNRGRIGSAAHAVIELLLKGQPLERALRKAVVDNKLTTPEIEDLMEYKTNILDFIERLNKYKNVHDVKNQLVEYRFGLTEDFKPTKFFDNNSMFRGVFDLALKLGKPVLVVMDHKSGEPKYKDTPGKDIDLTNYRDQLKSYAVAATSIFQGLDGVQTALHYVKTTDIAWDDYVATNKINTEFRPWLVDLINSGASNLETGPVATKGWYCNFCGYQNMCPAWNKDL